MTTPTLPVAGYIPFSTCDWEGKIVATIFTQGCPLQCLYCHNPTLIPFTASTPEHTPTWDDILTHLQQRQGLLDGVVISGGEPATHGKKLTHTLQHIRDLGYQTGIHTAGTYPNTIRTLLNNNLLNWVGLDIKTSPEGWQSLTNTPNITYQKTLHTLKLVTQSGINYETRTTIHPTTHTIDDLHHIATLLTQHHTPEWVLQIANTTDNTNLPPITQPRKYATHILSTLQSHHPSLTIRIRNNNT